MSQPLLKGNLKVNIIKYISQEQLVTYEPKLQRLWNYIGTWGFADDSYLMADVEANFFYI